MTIELIFKAERLSTAIRALKRASYSISQSMDAAGVQEEDRLSTATGKMLTNVLEAMFGHEPHIDYTADGFIYDTSGGTSFGIRYDGSEVITTIFVEVNRASTLLASAWMEGFRPEVTPDFMKGYDRREAERRIAADKAADTFRLDREQVYDLLEGLRTAQVARHTLVDNYDDADDDEYLSGAAMLEKLRSTKLFDD